MAKEDQIEEYRFDNRTPEEQREIAIKGGKASGEARREKATFKKAVEWLMNSDIKITKGNIYEALKNEGIDISKLSPTQQATIGIWHGAVSGNAYNYKTLMEVNGETLEEKPNLNPEVEKIEDVIDNSHLEKVLYEENKSDKDDER